MPKWHDLGWHVLPARYVRCQWALLSWTTEKLKHLCRGAADLIFWNRQLMPSGRHAVTYKNTDITLHVTYIYIYIYILCVCLYIISFYQYWNTKRRSISYIYIYIYTHTLTIAIENPSFSVFMREGAAFSHFVVDRRYDEQFFLYLSLCVEGPFRFAPYYLYSYWFHSDFAMCGRTSGERWLCVSVLSCMLLNL